MPGKERGPRLGVWLRTAGRVEQETYSQEGEIGQ